MSNTGSLPHGWTVTTVDHLKSPTKGSIVSGPFGSNIGKRFFVADGVPLIRGNNLVEGNGRFVDDGFVFITEEKAHELRSCEALPGDLVFTAAGTLGQVGLIPKNGKYSRYIISNKQLRARFDPARAFGAYLYYWFTAPAMRRFIANQNTGASVPLITLGNLRRLPVNLPPLDEQRKIAAILAAYDDLIENNTRRIAILEEMARSLYREWFVEFRFPGHEAVEKVESSVSLVPKGWSVKRIGDAVELAYGKALKADEREDGPFPVYGSSGVVGYHSASLVEGPGIIVGRKGNVGSVHWCDYGFYPIDTVFYVKSALSLYYIFFNFKTQNFLNNDAAVPGLNRNQAYSLPLVVPDEVILERFDALLGPMFAQIRLLREKNIVLRRARDLLLPRLVSGELDVSELDIDTGELSA